VAYPWFNDACSKFLCALAECDVTRVGVDVPEDGINFKEGAKRFSSSLVILYQTALFITLSWQVLNLSYIQKPLDAHELLLVSLHQCRQLPMYV
jgi:hypothetical protein